MVKCDIILSIIDELKKKELTIVSKEGILPSAANKSVRAATNILINALLKI